MPGGIHHKRNVHLDLVEGGTVLRIMKPIDEAATNMDKVGPILKKCGGTTQKDIDFMVKFMEMELKKHRDRKSDYIYDIAYVPLRVQVEESKKPWVKLIGLREEESKCLYMKYLLPSKNKEGYASDEDDEGFVVG